MPQNITKLLPPPPVAKYQEVIYKNFGDVRIDPYHWLENIHNHEVLKYLNAENKYTSNYLAQIYYLINTFYQETKLITKVADNDNDNQEIDETYIYQKSLPLQPYPVYCRKLTTNGKTQEQIILDINQLAGSAENYLVNDPQVSPDNNIIAISLDTTARESYTIYFKDLSTMEFLADKLDCVASEFIWSCDSQSIYYISLEQNLRAYEIRRHYINTQQIDDEIIYSENDLAFSLSIEQSYSKEYIFINSKSGNTTECWALPNTENNQEKLTLVCQRTLGHTYEIEHFNQTFYIKTNDLAENNKLLTTDSIPLNFTKFREMVAHDPNMQIIEYTLMKNYIALLVTLNGINKIRILSYDKMQDFLINLDDKPHTLSLNINHNLESNCIEFYYSSMCTPTITYQYDIINKQLITVNQEKYYNFDPNIYETKRIFAVNNHGIKIPISLLYKKDLNLAKPHCLLMYAYGAYGVSTEPHFDPTIFSLINRDFIYAIAHVRGGQELGYQWYRNGKYDLKINTFLDFITCAKYLINEKYTTSDILFANGVSSGGLLLGAAINMVPNLFNGIISEVPSVDILSTMLNQQLPHTIGDFTEWGNPSIEQDYQIIRQYSPYDNLKSHKFPHMLITAGMRDTQIRYSEPAKYVAKIRALQKNSDDQETITLLKTDVEQGHCASSHEHLHTYNQAVKYAFLYSIVKRKHISTKGNSEEYINDSPAKRLKIK